MKIRKSDFSILKEAESQGMMAGMSCIANSKRTALNDELSNYFRDAMPSYTGSFDEYQGEDLLYSINQYLKEKGIDKRSIDFPLSGGVDVHLIPITDNLELKLLVADEYNGGGDYAKYVMADFFMITEQTTKHDVDELIQFVKTNILAAI